ncbi:hypothetical protein RQP46_005608 [Phenoliferia psychrophenolica]
MEQAYERAPIYRAPEWAAAPPAAPTQGDEEAVLRYLAVQASAAYPIPPPTPTPSFVQGGVGWGLSGQAYFGNNLWSGPDYAYPPTIPTTTDGPRRRSLYSLAPLPGLNEADSDDDGLDPALVEQVFFSAPAPPAIGAPYTFISAVPLPLPRASYISLGSRNRLLSSHLPTPLASKPGDLCHHVVGAGSISNMVDPATHRTNFTVEVLCSHCTERYKSCSDCGSGGGGRLTPGKWRCKELFPENRRTCCLMHTRHPPAQDISCTVQRISDIHLDDIPVLEARCRQLYFHARLNEFARPESLEGRQELGRNFHEVEQMTTDAWNMLSVLFHEDIEESRGIRRYLTLQLAPPHGRRLKDKEKVPEGQLVVAGFCLCELEFRTGAILWSLAAPWSTTGVGYKIGTILGDKTLDHARADIIALNAMNPSLNYPPPQHYWIMASFRRESRLGISLARRGFMVLEEACQARPQTDRSAFTRDIWIPRQVVHAWETLVRYVGDGSSFCEDI